MDPIVGKLSLKAAQKINNNSVPNIGIKNQPSSFDNVMSQSKNSMIDVLEKLYPTDGAKKSNMEVISASDIEVSLDKIDNTELAKAVNPSDKIDLAGSAYDAFKSASWDMGKMTSMIENMANSSTDLPVRKLLQMQYMVGNMTTSVQIITKFPEQVAQATSQVMQTQTG